MMEPRQFDVIFCALGVLLVYVTVCQTNMCYACVDSE
jgi:hypothetical protein